jgi:hypothetical protein
VSYLAWSWTLGGAALALASTVLMLRGMSLEGFLPPAPKAPEFLWTGAEFVSVERGLQLRAGVLSQLQEASHAPHGVHAALHDARAILALYLAATSLSLGWLGACWKRHENTARLLFLGGAIVCTSSLALLGCSSQRLPMSLIVILSVGIVLACAREGAHKTKKPSTR